MKNKKRKILFVAFFVLATTVSLSLAYASYTPSTTLDRVLSGFTDGSVYALGPTNTEGCIGPMIQFHPDNTDVDKVYKVLLTALTSGKKIRCNVNGCIGQYQKGYQCYVHQDGK